MPIYVYKCIDCQEEFEKIQPVRYRNRRPKCPNCQEEMKPVIGNVSVQFKGEGWTPRYY